MPKGKIIYATLTKELYEAEDLDSSEISLTAMTGRIIVLDHEPKNGREVKDYDVVEFDNQTYDPGITTLVDQGSNATYIKFHVGGFFTMKADTIEIN